MEMARSDSDMSPGIGDNDSIPFRTVLFILALNLRGKYSTMVQWNVQQNLFMQPNNAYVKLFVMTEDASKVYLMHRVDGEHFIDTAT